MRNQVSELELLQLLFEETVGGTMFGLGLGFLAALCLQRVAYDGILVTTITAIFCYTLYMVAEFSVLRISGVVAVSIYGLYLGVEARPQLSAEASQFMKVFWSYLVFVAETNIFLMAGVYVGVNVYYIEGLINVAEITKLTSVYFLTLGSRFLSIAIFYNWLQKLGYGANWREIILITVAGLKGAVGISIAMAVFQTDEYSTSTRQLLLFYVTGNSILTLTINNILSTLLVGLLGLSKFTKVEHKMNAEFLNTLLKKI